MLSSSPYGRGVGGRGRHSNSVSLFSAFAVGSAAVCASLSAGCSRGTVFPASTSIDTCASCIRCSSSLAVYRLTLSIMPIYIQLMMVEVPPRLISGKGCPVTGARPTATIILNMACVTSSKAMPMTRKAGKVRLHFFAIRPALISRMM